MIPSPVKSHLLKTLTVCHSVIIAIIFSRQLSSALEHRDRSRPYASRLLSKLCRANYWRVLRNGISLSSNPRASCRLATQDRAWVGLTAFKSVLGKARKGNESTSEAYCKRI